MCQVVVGVDRSFDKCLPLAMISKDQSVFKGAGCETEVELQEVHRTRLSG